MTSDGDKTSSERVTRLIKDRRREGTQEVGSDGTWHESSDQECLSCWTEGTLDWNHPEPSSLILLFSSPTKKGWRRQEPLGKERRRRWEVPDEPLTFVRREVPRVRVTRDPVVKEERRRTGLLTTEGWRRSGTYGETEQTREMGQKWRYSSVK